MPSVGQASPGAGDPAMGSDVVVGERRRAD